MELKLKEKMVKDQFEQVEAKEQQLGLKRDFELKEKCLEQRNRELEAKEKHYDECKRKVELREKEIEELSAEHRRKYEQQSNELEFNVKKCEQRFRDLDLKEKKLVEWSKELERKNLALALHPQVKNESAALERSWLIGTEVAMALQLAAEPAKLVLDAMEGFYPPHLSKGDGEFEGNVARRSCILLLEQLMKISPAVKPRVRKEAMKLAFDWITKMRVESGHELEVLGFLRLLAPFQLAGAFDADELVNFLVFVAQHIQTPELFRALGLGDKITGKKQHMEAIRFIYAFEQVNEFPPVPVLKDFLNHSKAEARSILKKGKMEPKAQNEANTKRIADLRAVVKCIEDHKLESEYLPQDLKMLKNLILSLENINESRSITSPEANHALNTAPMSETSSQKQGGIKRPRELVAAEVAGNVPLGAKTTVSSNNVS
ncbi:FRIGIDA-like protein 3 [Hibiscus syriacus]|uniref:FRIGIDA-like protein 3 n=1 Tax=Hibiscus syriacus TaxID=106335 RepID=UPI001920D7FD|nr:FRIGIDA-like protein 3 [Hibiscus syriacus]